MRPAFLNSIFFEKSRVLSIVWVGPVQSAEGLNGRRE